MWESQRLGRCSISPATTVNHAYGAITRFQRGWRPGCKWTWRWSLCVCCPTLGFLDSHSHTGKLLTFSGESQPLQPNFCWSVSDLQASSGTETTSQEATSMNTAEQAATPSSLLTRDCSRVMEGYTPWASWTTLPIASCSLSWEKTQNQANGPWSLLYFTLFDLSAQQF